MIVIVQWNRVSKKKIGIQGMRLPEFSVDGSEVGRSHGR